MDGLAPIPKLVLQARKMGFSALAISDHGNIGGWIKFLHECSAKKDKKGKGIPYPTIKGILGCEMYISRFLKVDKDSQPDLRKGNRHLVLLAKNWDGYRNLCTLSHISWTEGYYYNSPRIDIDTLAKYSNGLICSSACMSNVINANLLKDRYDEAKKAASIFKDIFGEDFFLEVMYHGFSGQYKIMPMIYKLGKELDIPVIATNDVHFVSKEQAQSQEVYVCMSTGTCLQNPKRMKHPYPEAYLKSAEEMFALFGDHPEVLYNTKALADRVDTKGIEKNLFGGMRLPTYEVPTGFNSPMDYITSLAKEGLKKRKWDKSKKHIDQLKQELEDIQVAWEVNEYDFATYLLIVRDYINYAKEQGIMVGSGRGCLSPNVPILTNRGYININDVKCGDRVITKNGSFENVSKAHSYPCDEKLLNIKTCYGDDMGVSLTKDHKVLVEHYQYKDRYKKRLVSGNNNPYKLKIYEEPTGDLNWVRADEVKKGDWLFVPYLKRSGGRYKKIIDLWSLCDDYRLTLDTNDKHIIETRYIPCGAGIRSFKKIPRFIEIDEHFAWIIGKFMADGWLRSKRAYQNCIGFAFHSGEKKQIDYVIKYFEKLGFDISVRKSKIRKLVQIDVRSITLHKLFSSLFNSYQFSSQTKHVPECVFTWPESFIIAFIQGAFAGEGHVNKKYSKFVYTSVSKSLIYGMKHLLWLLRIPNSLLREKGEGRNNFQINVPSIDAIDCGLTGYHGPRVPIFEEIKSRPLNMCKLLPDGFLIKVRNISEERSTGVVCDLTVDNESNYLTSSFIVHNSGYGSVLTHCLGICSGLDPLKYGLLWERFLGFSWIKFIKASDFGLDKNDKRVESLSLDETEKVILEALVLCPRNVDRSKIKVELALMKKTSGLNDKNNLAQFYHIWQQSLGTTGHKNTIHSWTAFVLGMTDVEPSDEFLPDRRSYARVGYPDIDTDLDYFHRDRVIAFLESKHGKEHVAHIGTYNKMSFRAVVTRITKALDIAGAFHKGKDAYKAENMIKVNQILESIPKVKGLLSGKDFVTGEQIKVKTVQDAMRCFKDFNVYMTKTYPEIKKHSDHIEGLNQAAGIHAAGICLSKLPLREIAPLRLMNDGYATQFTGEELEELGIIKFDFLGLSTLSTIDSTLKLIKSNYGIDLDMDEINKVDDADTFKLYRTGKLAGVFQCEEGGMQRKIMDIGVDSFEDVMAAIALYRPGPLQFIPKYCACKHGLEKPDYFHPVIEKLAKPYLGKTYSIVVYQEQIMQICEVLAGLSKTEGYTLIKGVGKKKEQLVKGYRGQFIAGCVKNGIPENIAEEYWEKTIIPFSGYGFNACLTGDMRIYDKLSGNYYRIDELDHVLKNQKIVLDSYIDGKIIDDQLLETVHTGKKDVYEVELEDGIKIKSTLDHKFYCEHDGYEHTLEEIISNDWKIICSEKEESINNP